MGLLHVIVYVAISATTLALIAEGGVPRDNQETEAISEDIKERHRRAINGGAQDSGVSPPKCDQSDIKNTVLVGRDGRDGRDGNDGLPGEKGDAGAQGPKGDPGKNGEKGERGDTGSPGKDAPLPGTSGTTYVHWGLTTCPSTAQLVYKGIVGGSLYSRTGGAAQYLCLPEDPEYLQVQASSSSRHLLYSATYKISNFDPLSALNSKGAPCAVCRVIGRSTSLMIPAKPNCPSDWTREYRGYLMTAYCTHNHQYEFICVDENAETRPGSVSSSGAFMYPVEATCGSNGLPCGTGKYTSGNELTCAVCTI